MTLGSLINFLSSSHDIFLTSNFRFQPCWTFIISPQLDHVLLCFINIIHASPSAPHSSLLFTHWVSFQAPPPQEVFSQHLVGICSLTYNPLCTHLYHFLFLATKPFGNLKLHYTWVHCRFPPKGIFKWPNACMDETSLWSQRSVLFNVVGTRHN